MLKKTKLYIAISLFVQSVTFIITAVALYSKKKSLASTFLAIGLLGGTAGSILYALHEKERADARRMEAVDGAYSGEDEHSFEYSPCDYPDCSIDDSYEFPYVETEEAGEDEFDLGE